MAKKKHIFDTAYNKPSWSTYNQGICGTDTEDENLLDPVNFTKLSDDQKCKKCTKARIQIEEAIKVYKDRFIGYWDADVMFVSCNYIRTIKYMGGQKFRITGIKWGVDELLHRNEDDPTLLDEYVNLSWLKSTTIFPNFLDMNIDQFRKLSKLLAL